MHTEWLSFIQQEMAKDYMIQLKSYIDSERKTKVVYPAPEQLFSHMVNCPYDQLKVIIIGDHPFPSNINDGMTFSANTNLPPEENKNIIYEAYQDDFKAFHKSQMFPKAKIFPTNQLTEWAKQGVLLTNMVYTCAEGDSKAHIGKGWEEFNFTLLDWLSDNYAYPLVFINKSSHDIKSRINWRRHLLIGPEEAKWCTAANNFIQQRGGPAYDQRLRLKINWSTKRFD